MIKEKEEKLHKMFVYGTLRSGYGNHSVMPSNSKFIGNGKTVEMFRLTASGIPFVSKSEALHRVTGEVYEVTESAMTGPLDRLEGHPGFYTRELTPIELEDGTTEDAWLYFCESKGNTLIESGDYADYRR